MHNFRGWELYFTFETIIGRMHCLARVIVKLAMTTGWKSSILGYMSSGDRVPLVITTLWVQRFISCELFYPTLKK